MNQFYLIVHALAVPFRSRGRLLLLLLGLLAQPALAQTIRYVAPTSLCLGLGCADGSSWRNATNSLQYAIDQSSPGDQVWIAPGTYKPGGNSNTNRSLSFTLKSGVKVYGSVPFFATSLDERGTTLPGSTTLSGNIGNAERPDDNSYHVIRNTGTLNTGTLLDGVVIADGYANGGGEDGYAGGLYNVVNAGLHATIKLENCQFINNGSQSTAGALLSYANNGGSAIINCLRCRFENNAALYGGGAVFIGKNLFDAANQRYFGNTAPSQLNCEDCLFQNNQAQVDGTGGGLYLNGRANAISSFFKRCRFLSNRASNQGGAVSNLDGSLNFQNCSFVDNTALQGGALFTNNLNTSAIAQLDFTNCTFTANRSTTTGNDNLGGLLYMASRCRLFLTNSIVFNNGGNRTIRIQDASNTLTAINSVFDNTVTGYASAGNFTTTTSPFSNTTTLAILPCSPALNGSPPTTTSALIGTIDLNGNPRFFGGNADLGAVEYQTIPTPVSSGSISLNGQSASTTLCVGVPSLTFVSTNDGFSMGAYRWEARINGSGSWLTLSGATNATAVVTSVTINAGQTTEFRRVAIGCENAPFYSNTITARTFDPSLSAGGISGPPLVPVPQESSATLNSTATATAGYSLSITWQQSDDGTSWANIPNSNLQSTPLPTLETGTDLTVKTFYFRRKAQNGCASVAYSNTVVVTARDVTGQVEGKVTSGEGAVGVAGVLLTLRRLTNGLTGGLNNHSYTVLTGRDGTYLIPNIYWGFESGTQNSTVTQSQFVLTPSYGTHEFNPLSRPITMDKPRNVVLNQDFKDLSTYAISGKVEQHCTDCLPLNSETPGNVYCALDSVDVYLISRTQNLTLATQSQKLNNKYGQWNHTLTFPGEIQIIPRYRHYVFAPVTPPSFNVQNDVSDVNFTTTTSATIVGQLTAGCSDGTGIGPALLEFEDVPKKGASPNVCFRKRVPTDNNGNYYIELPARQYIVKVISFTASAGSEVIDTEVVDFFRKELLRDSLTRQSYIRNVTSATAVTHLNLVYPRPARIAFSALPQSPVCGSTPRRTMLEQFKPTSLSVSVFQGAPARGCPFTSGTLLVSGSFFGDGSKAQQYVVDSTGLVSLTLVAGLPNLIAPYEWKLQVDYTDKYGRTLRKDETIVVTGVQSGTAMFTTVSPQLPYFVLHDPPGDGSYSFRQLNSSSQVSTRQYVTLAGAGEYWAEVKIGSKLLSGIGIAVPSEAYGTISGKIKVEGGDTRGNERITTLTATTFVQTSSLPNFVGPDADVYYGAAENLYYSLGTEVLFDRDSCKFRTKKSLVMLHSGFAPNTDYAYTVGYIRNVIIPVLRNDLAALVDPSDESKRIYLRSQATVWEQLLKHHDENRRRAIYRKTVSFSGGATYSESSTSDTTATNTYDWSVAIDATVGGALGFEVAGSGASAGYSANFRTERGGSRVKGSGTSVTTGFSLSDDDNGDGIAMDVKDDAVYQTPLFDVLAGQTSCPPELGTQPRDDVQFYADNYVQTDVPADREAEFVLKLGNISSVLGNLDRGRTFNVSYVPASNPDGAIVTLGGNGQLFNVPFPVGRGEEAQITVRVGKSPSSGVFSYQNIQFIVADSCGGNDLKTVSLSVSFKGECSNVTLRSPEPDWLATANVSLLPIQIGGYNRNSLSRVALEYQSTGQSGWREAFVRTRAELNDGSSGTNVDWNTAGLGDGVYNIRLKLNCTLPNGDIGTVFSQSLRGRIDTTPPARFGNTLPLTSTFVTGDVIGAVYDEPLGCSRIRLNGSAVLASNGQIIPITVGCATNQIILMPTGSLAPFVGKMLSVTLSGIADVYGNVKPQPDIWQFYVGSVPAATGSQALSVLAANNAADKANTSGSIREDAPGTVDFTFQLPQPARNNIFVYFTVGGTARFGADYTVSYLTPSSGAQPLSATITGNNGLIVIPRGETSVRIKIDPVADPYFEPNETVIINLLNGGDYGLSAASSVTAIIENDDVQTNVITSVRNGYWEDPDTWDLARLPVTTDQVILDQNHTVTVSTIGIARKLTPKLNSRLRLLLPSSKLRLGF